MGVCLYCSCTPPKTGRRLTLNVGDQIVAPALRHLYFSCQLCSFPFFLEGRLSIIKRCTSLKTTIVFWTTIIFTRKNKAKKIKDIIMQNNTGIWLERCYYNVVDNIQLGKHTKKMRKREECEMKEMKGLLSKGMFKMDTSRNFTDCLKYYSPGHCWKWDNK